MSDNEQPKDQPKPEPLTVEKVLTVALPPIPLGKHWRVVVQGAEDYKDDCEKRKLVAIDSYINFAGACKAINEGVVHLSGEAAPKIYEYARMDPDDVPAAVIGLINSAVYGPLSAIFADRFLPGLGSLPQLLGITLSKNGETPPTAPSN